jgi:outer membrane protein assembly factor BamB
MLLARRLLASLIAIIPLVFCTSALADDEWARFRGPNGTGVNEHTSIPAQWTDKDFAWKIKLPGEGHSSPVVYDDQVFLLSADPETAARYIISVDANTGAIRWKKEYSAGHHALHAKSSYASSTPAVDADHVYAAWSDPRQTWLCALDHDGNEKWKVDLGGWIGQHGFGTSPMIAGDIVVLTSSQEPEKRAGGETPTDSFVVGVHRKTGEVVWRTPRKIDTASYSVPCLRKSESGEEEVVMATTAEGIFALDPATGQEKWSSGPLFTMRTVSSPVLWNDLIFGTTGAGQGGNYLAAYRPGDTKSLYEIRKEMPYVPTPILADDLMFLWSDAGIVTCVRPADGKQVWQRRVNAAFSGSPVRAGDKLFCVDEDGTVIVIAASDKFEELGRNPLGEKSHSTPAIAGGKMFVRTVSHLHAIKGERRPKNDE